MGDVVSRLSDDELAELCALADGTLPAERRAAVEARVAASSELQELVRRQRVAVDAARLLDTEPVPESLRTAARGRAPQPARRASRRRLQRLAAAGLAAAAAVAAVLVVLFTGGPAGPTVADAAALGRRAPTAAAPAAARAGATTLAVDVEGLAFPAYARPFGWQPVGVRRDRVDGRSATAVFYEKAGRRIAYVIVAGKGLPRPDGGAAVERSGVVFQTLELGGRPAVTWRRVGHTCVLTGDATRQELLALASWRAGGLRY
jgi:anti-sigma factor RsiW